MLPTVLNATCGGDGACGSSLIRVMEGQVSPPNLTEEAELGGQVKGGWRLACQAEVRGNLKIHIPLDSLATAQRTQTEGQSLSIDLNPAVRSVSVSLPPPNVSDLRSDAGRLRDALEMSNLTFPTSVLKNLSE